MIDKTLLTQVVNEALAGTDLFVVSIAVSHDNVLDVTIDSLRGVTLDDCMTVNNAVLTAFDRDVEDYELNVGSYGISEPFVVKPQHWLKNMGSEVEVLTTEGRKLKGTLIAATEQAFTISTPTTVKVEGKKRPQLMDVETVLPYESARQVKAIIKI